jgi:hypothetical protein
MPLLPAFANVIPSGFNGIIQGSWQGLKMKTTKKEDLGRGKEGSFWLTQIEQTREG